MQGARHPSPISGWPLSGPRGSALVGGQEPLQHPRLGRLGCQTTKSPDPLFLGLRGHAARRCMGRRACLSRSPGKLKLRQPLPIFTLKPLGHGPRPLHLCARSLSSGASAPGDQAAHVPRHDGYVNLARHTEGGRMVFWALGMRKSRIKGSKAALVRALGNAAWLDGDAWLPSVISGHQSLVGELVSY